MRKPHPHIIIYFVMTTNFRFFFFVILFYYISKQFYLYLTALLQTLYIDDNINPLYILTFKRLCGRVAIENCSLHYLNVHDGLCCSS